MSDKFIPFARPVLGQEEINEVVDSLESGWLATGPKVKRFTEDLKAYIDAPIVLPLTSGTAALHLALHGLNLQSGDEVLLSALTFAATYNTIEQAGGRPVPVDIDLDTLNLSIPALEAAITPKTRAIVPVHFAGLPVDLDAVYALAKKHNLRVIEDAAHAIGASYKGQKIGGFGDVQILSFHPNKNMTTGEGGAVVLRDEALADHIAMMSFHGFDKAAWNRHTKGGSQHYNIVLPGLKYNMMDLQAAIGIHQLAKLDHFIEARTQLVERYYELIADWPELILPARPTADVKHAYHMLNPRINTEVVNIDRNTFIEEMKKHNVGVGLHYESVHLSPYYREKYGYKEGDCPHTDRVCDTIFSLPLYPGLNESDQDRVVAAMSTVLRRTS